MSILVMANFKAECSGNFINSLLALGYKAKELSYNMVYMFPQLADGTERGWVEYMRNKGFTVITYSEALSPTETEAFLFQIIEDYKIDLIHSHFSCLGNLLLWNKELHNRVKIIFHDHMDYIADKPYYPQLKKQIKTAKRYREYGIGVISVMKKKHNRYLFVKNKWYIPNGITFERNVEKSLTREEMRQKLGISAEERLCLFLGWDIYRKGLDIAIRATQKVREQGYPLILGVVGFGADPDNAQLERIKSVIHFDPLQEGVRFLDSEEDMFALHRASDVYLSASRTEAFSYGILEAISQNVPVVASNISGTRWCLKYSKSLPFKTENTEMCAQAVIKALPMRNDPSNMDVFMTKYDIDHWVEQVFAVYQEFMNRN